MTRGIAAATANAELERFRGSAASAFTTVFAQLHTADPGAAGTTAISVGSTTRNAVTWNAASAGSMTLASLAAWTNGGTTETITDLSLWTLSSGGVFIGSVQLSVALPWVSTNTLTITTLTASRTPIAA
jgi:hypothetical protein